MFLPFNHYIYIRWSRRKRPWQPKCVVNLWILTDSDLANIDRDRYDYVLHWLPVAQRIPYRVAALVSRSILGCAPSYLRDLCRPVSDVVARRALRSATMGQLLIPRARLTARQRRAFSVVGPSIWNDLPSELRLLPLTNQTGFYKSLESFFFCHGWAGSASE